MALTRSFRLGTLTVLGLGVLSACPPPATTDTDTATDTDTSDGTDATTTGTPTTTNPTTTTLPTTSTTDDPSTSSTTDEPSTTTTDASTGGTTDASTGGTTDASTGGTTDEPVVTLCEKLGGTDGIAELVTGAFAVILVDDKVNGYFLNNDVDATNLGACLVKQLGELAQCDGVAYDCLDMKSAHAGLGISTNDFMDFAADFSTALDSHQMAHPALLDQDKTDILTALGGMAPDIVEDANNDLTVYQRVGRKPALRTLIGKPGEAGSFVDNVANNDAINGFFGATDFERLNTCLTRQVGGIDGPARYGLEVDAPPPADPGVGVGSECKDMSTSHMGLVDTKDMIGIDINDFGALVADLVAAMNTAGVAMADQDAILAVLAPMCSDILAPLFKNDCPGNSKDETVEKAALALAIPDDLYDGSIGSMGCVDLDVPDDGINFVLGAEVTVALDHVWAGDVTIKVQSPDMKILTLVSRPGLNEAEDGQGQCCGDSSNFDKGFPLLFKNGAANQAESMGATILTNQIICKDEVPPLMSCEWVPNPGKGPGIDFTDFVGGPANGTWKVCAGDGSGGDTGTLDAVKLVVKKGKFDPTP